jgi:hypothetical protein
VRTPRGPEVLEIIDIRYPDRRGEVPTTFSG